MLTETEILEAGSIAPAGDLVGSRYKVRLIEGNKLGSTGYYPAETLLRDGPKVFTKGTPMFLDHQTPEERANRPNGSVTLWAGELAEDAYYDNDGLYAEINVFEHQQPLIKSLKDKIGISIRARGIVQDETINGQKVPVFKQLTLGRSADFVVKPGAGGKIVSILESALDSETASESEEGSENMDEVLKELASLRTDFVGRLETLEEAAKPAEVVEEKLTDESVMDKAIELAEAFVSSNLDADGRKRVLDLHRANKKPIAELIEAEEAYVKSHTSSTAVVVEGVEEEAVESATEKKSEKFVPRISAWSKK